MDFTLVSRFTFCGIVILTLLWSNVDCTQYSVHPNGGLNSNDTSDTIGAKNNGTHVTQEVLLIFNPPDALNIEMDSGGIAHVNYSLLCNSERVLYMFNFLSAKPSVASLGGRTRFSIGCGSDNGAHYATHGTNLSYPEFVEGHFNISVFGELLGRTKLEIEVTKLIVNTSSDHAFSDSTDSYRQPTNTSNRYFYEYTVLVRREQKPINVAFQAIITTFAVLSAVAMGCKTDLRVVIADLKKPFAPAIGLFCQYVVMPMIAFTIASTVKFEDPIMSFGIFALGCSPGGGTSNVYTYLIDGDVSLSVTMTTISSLLALGLFPAWVLTVGRRFLPDDRSIDIPYLNVFAALSGLFLPLAIGLLIQYKKPKVARAILKYSKPILLVVLIATAILLVIANLYMFRLFTGTTILAGACLPYFGYLIGGVIAWITRHPWKRIKTIALETGLQNTGVAMITLLFSLPQPYNEIAAVCPAASAIMSSTLVGLVVSTYVVQKKCRQKFSEKKETEDSLGTLESSGAYGSLNENKITDDGQTSDEKNKKVDKGEDIKTHNGEVTKIDDVKIKI